MCIVYSILLVVCAPALVWSVVAILCVLVSLGAGCCDCLVAL